MTFSSISHIYFNLSPSSLLLFIDATWTRLQGPYSGTYTCNTFLPHQSQGNHQITVDYWTIAVKYDLVFAGRYLSLVRPYIQYRVEPLWSSFLLPTSFDLAHRTTMEGLYLMGSNFQG